MSHHFMKHDCRCIGLPDLAVVDMGEDDRRVFATLEEEVHRGDPFWWLSAYRCRICGDWWLVAQEERQNDVSCMRRLQESEVTAIRAGQEWPRDFDRYEDLLRIGKEAGKRVEFLDPLDLALRLTVRDLAMARPEIRVSELAPLLNLDLEAASALAHAVVQATGVSIGFDVERAQFTGEVLAGRKEAAIEVPFDPAKRWNVEPVSVRPGRRGYKVNVSLAGVSFQSFVVSRFQRFWVLLDDESLRAAGIVVGDSAAVSLSPR